MKKNKMTEMKLIGCHIYVVASLLKEVEMGLIFTGKQMSPGGWPSTLSEEIAWWMY